MGATQGMSKTPVQNDRQRMLEVSTSAITTPSTILKPTEPNVKIAELTTARWKKPSHASRT